MYGLSSRGKQIFQEIRFETVAVANRFAHKGIRRTHRDSVLILFYNDVFGTIPNPTTTPHVHGVSYSADRRLLYEADAVVFHVPNLVRLPRWKPRGQLWIAWSQESSVNIPRLQDPAFLHHMDLTMTYRQDADVWVPYFSFYPSDRFLGILRQVPHAKTTDRLIASFVSSSIDKSGRVAYLTELGHRLDLHAYGRIGRNLTMADDSGHVGKLETIATYKFTIAFENSIDEDYVTEKFFDPLVAGSVPVYLGAPNIDQFIPGDHCYINVRDFDSPRELAEYLLHLNFDDDAYSAYFAWKHDPFRPGFSELYDRYINEVSWIRLSRLIRNYVLGQ